MNTVFKSSVVEKPTEKMLINKVWPHHTSPKPYGTAAYDARPIKNKKPTEEWKR